MDKLISNSAAVEISQRIKGALRALVIDDWQSGPHCQHHVVCRTSQLRTLRAPKHNK